MGSENWLDLIMLIILLAIGSVSVASFAVMSDMDIAIYDEDKTAINAKGSVYVDDTIKTGADLLMSLVVTDDMLPYPRAIKINDSPVIQLTKEWVTQKSVNIAAIYNTSGAYKLGSMLDWQITSVSFDYSGSVKYIHYVLQP